MKKQLALIVSTLLSLALWSQNYDPGKVDKKAKAFYDKGLELAQDGYYPQAIEQLQEAIKKDAKYADAYLSLAGVYGQMKNYAACVLNYEKAFSLDPEYTLDFKLPYSINLAGKGEFEKALAAINELLEKKPPQNSTSLKAAMHRKQTYEFAIAFAKKHNTASYNFNPINLGTGVNSPEPEYFPTLTIDGNSLVFTRSLGKRNEDFFISKKNEQGEWLPAEPMPGSVNTPMNEGAQTVSQDGQWIVFTGCNRKDGFGSCDLYISYLDDNGWSEAINLGGGVNSDQWESQPSLSPDKRDLYFASRRPGGYGGVDIYVTHLQENGKWSEPENLGPEINTPGDEQSPFIHADNETLYFVSDHWPGYGDDDLFLSRKGPKGSWSKPENLGYPINTINKEATLFITADGRTAFYASDRSDSKGSWDIYSFELREAVRPTPTLWVRGQVYDAKTKQGLPSTVELSDLATGQTVSQIQTDEKGNYLITLPLGRDYAFNVNRKGYLFYSDNFMFSKAAADSTYLKNIPLSPIEANASFILNNIFFDNNQYELRRESGVELLKLVTLLKENSSLKIEISGHTDNVGKPADNLTLSNNRAQSVVKFLIEQGITPNRLTAKGFGETKPIGDNSTDAGRAKNRRTEVKVLSP